MLSKKERKLLYQAFEAPESRKKRAFLRTLPKEEVGVGKLILSQAAYIRKWVWGASLPVLALALFTTNYVKPDAVWVLSAAMPFIAMCMLTELAKSSTYGMAELEMTARFSMRTLLFARMAMIGSVQLLTLLLLLPFAGKGGMEQGLRNGLYLLVPYLLTAVPGMAVVRRMRGREGLYACGAVSAFVSVLCPLSGFWLPVIYAEQNVVFWGLAVVLLCWCFRNEYRKTINQIGEMIWN